MSIARLGVSQLLEDFKLQLIIVLHCINKSIRGTIFQNPTAYHIRRHRQLLPLDPLRLHSNAYISSIVFSLDYAIIQGALLNSF